MVDRYVLIRDDDVNALTPIDYLDILYRPFLDRGLPVNLAVIPYVNTYATTAHGHREEFLIAKSLFAEKGGLSNYIAISEHKALVDYLLSNSCYHIAQHGYHHDHAEFSIRDRKEIARRLDKGIDLLMLAGFPRPVTFVAPHDIMSYQAILEASLRYPIISKNVYHLSQLPFTFWPSYLWWRVVKQSPHWRHKQSIFLTRPNQSYLSSRFRVENMFERIKACINSRRLTVLHTHWWSYFKHPQRATPFVQVLHKVAAYLADSPNIRTIAFSDILKDSIPLH